MSAYETTTVAVERSQADIRRLLASHGAERFAFGEDVDAQRIRWAAVTFTHEARTVRMKVPHKVADETEIARKARRSRSKTHAEVAFDVHEQEARRIWRVIAWNLKARLVAVEEGVETFEEAFLAHLLNERTGNTLYEELVNDGRIELGAPLLMLGRGGEE